VKRRRGDTQVAEGDIASFIDEVPADPLEDAPAFDPAEGALAPARWEKWELQGHRSALFKCRGVGVIAKDYDAKEVPLLDPGIEGGYLYLTGVSKEPCI